MVNMRRLNQIEWENFTEHNLSVTFDIFIEDTAPNLLKHRIRHYFNTKNDAELKQSAEIIFTKLTTDSISDTWLLNSDIGQDIDAMNGEIMIITWKILEIVNFNIKITIRMLLDEKN